MTTVAQIINDAFRISNLVATGTAPNPNEQQEALRHLNNLVKSSFGLEAGEDLVNLALGREGISRPIGYPWFDDPPGEDWYVPKNARIMANLEQATELFLHPEPDDGSRFAVIDNARNLATNNLTVNANGRRIEGARTLVLNGDGINAEWFYRGDLGEWIRTSPLDLTDTFPFPQEFDDFFSIMLAIRVNPSYGKSIDGQAEKMLRRAESQMRSRYGQTIFMPVELGIYRLPHVAANRRGWTGPYTVFDPNVLFEKGWPN